MLANELRQQENDLLMQQNKGSGKAQYALTVDLGRDFAVRVTELVDNRRQQQRLSLRSVKKLISPSQAREFDKARIGFEPLVSPTRGRTAQ